MDFFGAGQTTKYAIIGTISLTIFTFFGRYIYLESKISKLTTDNEQLQQTNKVQQNITQNSIDNQQKTKTNYVYIQEKTKQAEIKSNNINNITKTINCEFDNFNNLDVNCDA